MRERGTGGGWEGGNGRGGVWEGVGEWGGWVGGRLIQPEGQLYGRVTAAGGSMVLTEGGSTQLRRGVYSFL